MQRISILFSSLARFALPSAAPAASTAANLVVAPAGVNMPAPARTGARSVMDFPRLRIRVTRIQGLAARPDWMQTPSNLM